VPVQKQNNLVIVGDIGGTNGRLAIASVRHGHEALPKISHMRTYQSTKFAGLTPMLKAFLNDVKSDIADIGGIDDISDLGDIPARLAIAGPTTADKGWLTNLGWAVDAPQIAQDLGLGRVKFLNDFAALAYAAAVLEGPQVMDVKKGSAHKDGPISIMGPGTGFGVALLVRNDNSWTVIPTEGGHMAFSPVTKLEEDLCTHLRREHGHVSVETLICGKGLARIHRFLVEYAGSGDKDMQPAEISAAAHDGTIPSCVRAVQLFLSILGSVAGDIALVHGATGGVYFGGGILPKIANQLDNSDIADRFIAKGAMEDYLSQIPIKLITSHNAALIGAAIAP